MKILTHIGAPLRFARTHNPMKILSFITPTGVKTSFHEDDIFINTFNTGQVLKYVNYWSQLLEPTP